MHNTKIMYVTHLAKFTFKQQCYDINKKYILVSLSLHTQNVSLHVKRFHYNIFLLTDQRLIQLVTSL